MRTLFLALCLLFAACKDHPVEATANAAPVPRAHPVHTTPKALVADFTRPDADGLTLLDKYRDGATFTGMLQTVDGDVVLMSVDGKNVISLAFTNPAQTRAHRAGERVTVTCRISGATGALMMVSDCVL